MSLVAILIITTALVSAENTNNVNIRVDDSLIQTANELMDNGSSAGEYISTMFPEAWNDLPQDFQEFLYTVSMGWAGSEGPLETHVSLPQSYSMNQQVENVPMLIGYIGHISYITAHETSVDFESGSRSWLPTPWTDVPYMAVSSTLIHDGSILLTAFDAGGNVHAVSASDTYYNWEIIIPKPGFPGLETPLEPGIYTVIGNHWGTLPQGSNPPNYTEVSEATTVVN